MDNTCHAAQPSSPMLEIAIQTILYKNKTRLSRLADEADTEQLEAIAKEIAHKAIVLQQITDAVVLELDALHQRAEQCEDERR